MVMFVYSYRLQTDTMYVVTVLISTLLLLQLLHNRSVSICAFSSVFYVTTRRAILYLYCEPNVFCVDDISFCLICLFIVRCFMSDVSCKWHVTISSQSYNVCFLSSPCKIHLLAFYSSNSLVWMIMSCDLQTNDRGFAASILLLVALWKS